jgi:hypothetical protein
LSGGGRLLPLGTSASWQVTLPKQEARAGGAGWCQGPLALGGGAVLPLERHLPAAEVEAHAALLFPQPPANTTNRVDNLVHLQRTFARNFQQPWHAEGLTSCSACRGPRATCAATIKRTPLVITKPSPAGVTSEEHAIAMARSRRCAKKQRSATLVTGLPTSRQPWAKACMIAYLGAMHVQTGADGAALQEHAGYRQPASTDG